MGTRSDIIAHIGEGRWARIYCHWDGYLDHNGAILNEHYRDQKKVEALIALGDLSSLGAEIGEKHPFDGPHAGGCNAYGRDRGETGTEAKVFDSLAAAWPEDDTWTEYTYVWDGEEWFVADADEGSQSGVRLTDALAGDNPKPAIKSPWGVLGLRK